MDRINTLRAKQGKIADDMEALLEKAATETRDLNDAEKQAFKDFESELERIKEAIALEERVIAVKASLAKPMTGIHSGGAVAAAPRRRHYGRALKGFKSERFASPADAEDAAYRAGMWCRAAIYDDQKAAQWCAEHDVPVTRAQNEGSNTAGGYVVFDEMSQAIIDLREQYGVFRQFARVVQMASDVQLVPKRTGGVTASFAAEATAFTESEKTWGQVRLQAQALGALTRISRELADDAVISVADDIAAEMAYAMAVKEDSVGWDGTGAAADGGIIGVRTKIIDGTHTASAIDAATGNDTFAEITATDMVTAISAVPAYAEPTARWYGSQRAYSLVALRLAAAAGGNTIETLMDGKPTRAYLGYPWAIDQTLPSVTTDLSNVAMLFIGDLSMAVTMGERQGITIDVSRERYWELRQIAIMGWERIDINAHDLGDNTTAGPIIALIGE